MWHRYVAIGDSTTEGLDDPDGAGGYRGWADRFALAVAATQGGLEYANLAIRGRTAGQIRAVQLPVALRLAPDLATVVAGMNDVLRPSFDARAVAADVQTMQEALVDLGATVLTFTLPDPVPVMPIARPLRGRVLALNEELRRATARTGATLLDLGAYPVASDPRLWSDDRLHANPAGHARIAAALAHTLGLPGADGTWSRPLPSAPRRRRAEVVRAELAWTRRHLLPWLLRQLPGRSIGDGRIAKRPVPLPVGI
ncbi:SGNH/GDSL hydrolase family protein [Plantactinospora sp. KBS50]|uniref:SGNH/GDSL hydrolase family protein n=1 Tax=Plantactinospora sp. KBS50 TaxID=2024580 RepID=UPI000BAABBE4|nr:SGNH/GDSL hydrolase family protein [Plantactinospora sp. KBS50]ASW54882.1 lysophospholipase [Plantactinospora sp. KBS50]